MTTASEFDRLTSLTPLGNGRYAADLPSDWVVAGAVNGGLQMTLVGKAVLAEIPGKPDPISISGMYLSAGVPGPCEIRVEVKRVGGNLAVAAAELWQGDELRLTALAQVGDLEKIGATAWGEPFRTAVEPEIPPQDQCISTKWAPAEVKAFAPFLQQFDLLFHPAHAGFSIGKPGRSGILTAWFRLEDREPDPISLLLAMDALPPTSLDFGMNNWAPTLELTCHVRRRPAPGWLKLSHSTRVMEDGLFEEDCEIWDSTGHLVAQARQLVRQPRPM